MKNEKQTELGESTMKKLNLLFVLALTACASTNDAMQRESAISIGGNARPDAVQLRNVDRGATSVKWEAVSAGKVYDCSADDMLRRVKCFPK